MILHSIRDGAAFDQGRMSGLLAKEVLHPQRFANLMPPSAELSLVPGALYAIHTGLQLRGNASKLAIKPNFALFKTTGMTTQRVELSVDGELIVYVTVIAPSKFDKAHDMFVVDSTDELVFAVGQTLQSAVGFVPVAHKTIEEPNKSARSAQAPRDEDDSEAKRRAAAEAWLREDDKLGQTVTPNTTPGNISVSTSNVKPFTGA